MGQESPHSRLSEWIFHRVQHDYSRLRGLAKVLSVQCLALTLIVVSPGSLVEELNPPGGGCLEWEPREVEESDSQGVADLVEA